MQRFRNRGDVGSIRIDLGNSDHIDFRVPDEHPIIDRERDRHDADVGEPPPVGDRARLCIDDQPAVFVNTALRHFVDDFGPPWCEPDHVAIPAFDGLPDPELASERGVFRQMQRLALARTFLKNTTLEEFDFVGLQEHFTEDVWELARLMDWQEIEPEFVNASRDAAYCVHRCSWSSRTPHSLYTSSSNGRTIG